MADSADLLFELGTEELPPTALKRLMQSLEKGFLEGLNNAGLSHGECRAFATPRRLALLISAQLVALGHTQGLIDAVSSLARGPVNFVAVQAILFAVVALLFLPVTLLFGASFPLAVAADPVVMLTAHINTLSAQHTAVRIVIKKGVAFVNPGFFQQPTEAFGF